ncbi:chromosome transmission fidelity-like protein [Carex rostrata]
MEIKVKCNCGVEQCPEWAILELQGVVESQPSIANQIQGLEIGRLCCSSSASSLVNYTFTVGYHELSGTKLSLKKPLLVLKKKKVVQQEGSDSNDVLEFEVIGVIRHKILFKSRPKALISKPQVKDKKASDK